MRILLIPATAAIGVVAIHNVGLMVGVDGGFRTLSALFFLPPSEKGSPGRTAARGSAGGKAARATATGGRLITASADDLRVGLPTAAERLVDSDQVVDYLLIALRQ